MRSLEQSTLVVGSGDLWAEAVRSRFLDALADGSLPAVAFQRWLMQDYHFALGLTSYQALMIAKAPREAHAVLIGGLGALGAELTWFEEHASRLKLDLHGSAQPACRRYVDCLLAAAYTRSFPVLATMLFGVEVTYLCAWSALRPEGPYAEFIARWSNPRFVDYVRSLQSLAEAYPHPQQQEVFDEVLRHEREFWRMTWEG